MKRRWLELGARADAVEGADDLLIAALLALGGQAVFEHDGWQVTHLPEPEVPGDFIVSAATNIETMTGLEGVEVRAEWRDDEDWSEVWRRGLGPRRIGKRIVVRPSWTEQRAGAGDLEIVIDPGVAFGTAEHGTTRGCLRLLEDCVGAGDRVLDVGAGSGILSVAAALLGAAEVVGFEGDTMSCDAMNANVKVNHVSRPVRLVCAWADRAMLAQFAPVDGVVANIETGQLRPLLKGFRCAVRPGGWLLLSGILHEEWDEFRSEVDALGFELSRMDDDDVWRSGLWRLTGESV